MLVKVLGMANRAMCCTGVQRQFFQLRKTSIAAHLGVVGLQVVVEQVAPVAVEAVLLVDQEDVGLLLGPLLLEHVRNSVLVMRSPLSYL